MTLGPSPDRARPNGLRDRLADDDDVVAVDDAGGDVVGGRSVCCRVVDRGDGVDRRVLHVEVVLADEQDRQLPDRGEIERLVERPDVRRTVTEEGDGDLVGAAQLRRPGGAAAIGRCAPTIAYDPSIPLSARVRCIEPPFALQAPVALLISSARHSAGRRTTGDRVVMAAVGRDHVVVVAQGRARADGNRLVPRGEVRRALDQAGHEQVVGSLLDAADDGHFLEPGQQVGRLDLRSRRTPLDLVLVAHDVPPPPPSAAAKPAARRSPRPAGVLRCD